MALIIPPAFESDAPTRSRYTWSVSFRNFKAMVQNVSMPLAVVFVLCAMAAGGVYLKKTGSNAEDLKKLNEELESIKEKIRIVEKKVGDIAQKQQEILDILISAAVDRRQTATAASC